MEYPSSNNSAPPQWPIAQTSTSTVSPVMNESLENMLASMDELPSSDFQLDFANGNLTPPEWIASSASGGMTPMWNGASSNIPPPSFGKGCEIQQLSSSTDNATPSAGNWNKRSESPLSVPINPVDSSVDKDHRCTFCKYVASSKAALGSHQRKHGKYYVCRICPANLTGSGEAQFPDISKLEWHFNQAHKDISKKRIRDNIDVRFKDQGFVLHTFPPQTTAFPRPIAIAMKTEQDVQPQVQVIPPNFNQDGSTSLNHWFVGDEQQIANICNMKFNEFKNGELQMLRGQHKAETDSLNMRIASLEFRLQQKDEQLARFGADMQNITSFIQGMGNLFVRPLPLLPLNPIQMGAFSRGGEQQDQPDSNQDREGNSSKRPRN